MQLNQEQGRACEALVDWWYRDPRRPFRLDGYAGTGKTTVVQFMLQELGLHKDTVRLLAPTGKAARILGQKTGLPSSTIHRELYKPVESRRVAQLRRQLAQVPTEDTDQIHELRKELARAEADEGVGFDAKDVDTGAVRLYVVDEASMISEQLARDLQALRVPLVLLGDPGQLPPVKAKPGFEDVQPVATLTQIMRQDEGSAILEAAQAVRNGQKLPFGDRGAFKRIPRQSLTDEDYAAFDVLLCGTHKFRMAYNRRLRRVAQGSDAPPLPLPHDRLVCRKNDYRVGVMNGQLLTATTAAEAGVDGVSASVGILDDEGTDHGIQDVSAMRMLQHYDKRVPVYRLDGALDVDYAYALTVHSAQGSEWSRVVVLNDWPGKDYARWLYTALTRGADEVVLVG